MRLTKKEQQVCDYYSQRGPDGLVRCNECPLEISRRYCICKASATRKEWKEYLDDLRWLGDKERLDRALLKEPRKE